MDIKFIIIAVLAVCGVVWCYPRLPTPWNFVLVGLVAIACVFILLSLGGINTGLHM